MSDYSEKDYWESIQGLGEEVRRQVTDEGADESDALHECVDDSEWVIYTYRARLACMYSKNEDAIFDAFGSAGEAFGGATSMAEIFTATAFYAIQADVAGWLAENPAEETEVAS